MQDAFDSQCCRKCSQPEPRSFLRICGWLGSSGRRHRCHCWAVCGLGHHAVHAVLEERAQAARFEKLAKPS